MSSSTAIDGADVAAAAVGLDSRETAPASSTDAGKTTAANGEAPKLSWRARKRLLKETNPNFTPKPKEPEQKFALATEAKVEQSPDLILESAPVLKPRWLAFIKRRFPHATVIEPTDMPQLIFLKSDQADNIVRELWQNEVTAHHIGFAPCVVSTC